MSGTVVFIFAEDDFRRFHFRRNEFFTENHLT
jgi:hypothetical protein